MNDIDYDKLSSMVADKVSSQIAEKLIQKTTKLTLSRPEVEVRIGFAPGSSAAREVMKDPKFPKPDAFSENGRDRWYTKDIDDTWKAKDTPEPSSLFQPLSNFFCARSVVSLEHL